MFHGRHCEGMVFADDILRALMAVGRQVAVGGVTKLLWPALPSKIVKGRRGSLPKWTSLGANTVAALTELLYETSTTGRCSS